ncbi:MAG TPA: S26 family signal peptidase [Gemmataceae bacterium]|jgi:signal peptidase I|nr:S26 family signal peptidase [Gemmataceae bacterium]
MTRFPKRPTDRVDAPANERRYARWLRLVWLLPIFAAFGIVGCDSNYSSGDRVLVAKAPYDLKLKPPERFDVVVFKYPKEPSKRGVPTNYIKRLIGLPGEIIAIFFGQLFRMPAPVGAPIPGEPENIPPLDKWAEGSQPHGHEYADFIRKGFETGSFEILRKPPVVMLAQRRIVFDNNFQPSDLRMFTPRWNPRDGSAWKSSGDRKTFTFGHEKKAENADKVDWLSYQHLPRPTGPIVGGMVVQKRLITDFMGYNSFNLEPPATNSIQVNWAGNLMLEANVTTDGTGGEFWMEVNKGIDRFQAKFDLATGQCTLFRVDEEGKARQLDAKPTALTGTGTHMVRFANFSAQLTVWVDGTLPFGNGVPYDPIELGTKENPVTMDVIRTRCGPRPNDLERPASLGGKGMGATVADIRLWRDTFYTMDVQRPDVQLNEDMLADPQQWGTFHHLTPTGYSVYPGHYLCLGDNSTSSSDSRAWGLVPERLMLGRALAVYFPIERAGLIR